MSSKPVATLENKSIFAENSIIELKYKNEWKKGVILSSSPSNGIIIELMITADNYKQIKLYHSIAMTYYHINKTLKTLNIKTPQQLFTIGTNIEYKCKNKQWKNGSIIHINTRKLNQTKIKINKTIHKDKIITISRAKLIMDYIFHKTIKLTNQKYPFWILCNQTVWVKDLSSAHSPYIPYKVACYRDGKSMTIYKTSAKDAINIKHSDIKTINSWNITTDKYLIKPQNKQNIYNISSIKYEWQIKSDTINNTKNLLCNGYVKKHYNQWVTTVIVQLISGYVSDILEDMKNASHKQAFYTSVVSIKSFQWYLKIYPNGLSKYNKGYFEVYLCCQSIPSKLKWIKIHWKLTLKETKCIFTRRRRTNDFFEKQFEWDLEGLSGIISGGYGNDPRVSLESIQDLSQLTFEIEMKYHSVLDKNNHFMKFDEHYYTNPILN